MIAVGNVMILASAGSGKTYALTNRFVRLLALGAKPDRIVALTFTRKASGEFFDEILKKLARGASDSAYAKQLAFEIGRPELTVHDFLRMLRVVVDAMHRLQLGTFDGFFARIARNFPLELGLSGEFEILQEHAAKVERTRVLRRMFERTGALGEGQREFIEAFKRATFGRDEKRLGAHLDAFLDEHQEIFLSAPEHDYWGNAVRIWPNGPKWSIGTNDTSASIRQLRAWLRETNVGEKQRTRWEDFLRSWSEWSPGVVPDRALAYVLEKTLAVWHDVESGCAVLEFDRKKQELTPTACAALADLTRHVVATEIARRMEVTRGIHAVVSSYEAVYHDGVRRAGKLTFGDVQRLLVPTKDGSLALSQEADDEQRLFIDFRLDAEIDHWLLDEFQDTSFGQWMVLRNLIDEALQDPTGGRSFFYVGDVKQAIFAWREGDPRLFREIFSHYNAVSPGTIAEQHLVKSWRSGPDVIAVVNRVFGDAAVLSAMFPGSASEMWNREWRAHESAKPRLRGQVALLHAEDEVERFSTTAALLREIDPLARGLTCAVLVQTNQTAAYLADYLRKEVDIAAVADADLHVCIDNPLGCALLALVKTAAHPGDTLAAEHLRMTPLGSILLTKGIDSPERLTEHVLAAIHRDGFERCMGRWIQLVEPMLAPDDAFTRQRGRQFTAAAALFDATGSRDVAEFLEFMERYTVRDVEGSGAVRIMTIHKAKGLGFDLVLLPDLEGMKLDCRRDGLAVRKSSDRSVEWVLDLPGKLFHSQDEVLSAYVRSAEADACYEALSLLYVALTRAKHGLYIITKPPGKSTSRNFPRLLAETMGEEAQEIMVGEQRFTGAYATGSKDWYSDVQPRPASDPARVIGRIDASQLPTRSPLIARRPSGEHHAELSGFRLFALDQSRATGFGTAVHRLLAQVEWAGSDVARLVADWRSSEVEDEVINEVVACVEAPTLASIWKQPAFGEVWRERAFEVVIDQDWITGIFDRVVIERDKAGAVVGVVVVDFKTDLVAPGEYETVANRYVQQLDLYRRVVAVLTGMGIERVAGAIVFTRVQKIVSVRPAVSGR